MSYIHNYHFGIVNQFISRLTMMAVVPVMTMVSMVFFVVDMLVDGRMIDWLLFNIDPVNWQTPESKSGDKRARKRERLC